MRRSHSLLLSFLLLAACDIEKLALDTDDGDGSTSGGTSSGGSPTAETGDTEAPAFDPTTWASEMAARRCAALERCDCPTSCNVDIQFNYEDRVAWAQSVGAHLSPACYEQHVAELFDGLCEDTVPDASPRNAGNAADCKLFSGDAGLGQPCESRGAWIGNDDTCVEELQCVAGVCIAELEEGEACNLDGSSTARCRSPLRCGESGVCEGPRYEGEACDRPLQCNIGFLTCGDEGTCVPAGATGAECELPPDCLSYQCVEGRCEPPLASLCGPYAWEEG